MSLDKYTEMIAEGSTPMVVIPTGEILQGHIKEPVKAVLFDIYGTLFISGSGDLGAVKVDSQTGKKLQHLLDQYGLDMGWQVLLEKFKAAIKRDHQTKQTAGTCHPEVRVEEIWAQVLESTDKAKAMEFSLSYELLVNPVYPMPHLQDTLTRVRQSGVRMGLISNAQFFTPLLFHAFLKKSPQQLGFDADLLLYSFQQDVAKPSGILFQKAADTLIKKDISPANVVYVGNDMRNDVVPAQQVGFQTVLFAGDKRSLRWRREDSIVRGYHPHMLVVDLPQILKAIE